MTKRIGAVLSLLLFCLLIQDLASWSEEGSFLGNSEIIGEDITYEVQPGDTLYSIAIGKNISYTSLINANSLKTSNLIFPGQKLVIPTRKIVPKWIENGLIVNLPEYAMYAFRNGEATDVYSVAIGLETWRTPTGNFTVIRKVKNPTWYIPKEMAERLKIKREIIPPGPLNPLGDLWIGLDLAHIGIHSTNKPMSIGRPLSHGCLRLYPWDAQKLFKSVQIGTQGEIVYEPIKVAIDNEDIFIEVHKDVYNSIPDMEAEALRRLGDLGLIEKIDLEMVKEIIKKAQGIPSKINKTLVPQPALSSEMRTEKEQAPMIKFQDNESSSH